MADNFGLKIGLEGEKEFKKALSEINQSFKVLGSEMKLVESAFAKNDNSVQALTARNQVLNREIEAQKQKIETLRAALANAAESFGENDRRTQNWQIQLNNAIATLNQMERELNDNNTALNEADRHMDDVSDSAKDMGKEVDDAAVATAAIATPTPFKIPLKASNLPFDLSAASPAGRGGSQAGQGSRVGICRLRTARGRR